MKLKRISKNEIIHELVNMENCPLDTIDAQALSMVKIAQAIARVQVKADQKMVDTLELAQEGYTEMAKLEVAREIFEWLGTTSMDAHTIVFQVSEKEYQARKQECLGGEK